jgi:16S rRNA processing protein RimM
LSYAELLTSSTAIVKFEDIDTPEEIKKLIGINLFFKKVDLLQKEGNEFSWRDLIRFKIVDEMLGEIGLVNDIFFYPDNPVFQIIKHGREILIPVNEDLIQKIDPESKTVFMVLPEGLTDIFR